MFALLLAAAMTGTYIYPPDPATTPLPPTITVDFGAGGKVTLPRPRPDLDVSASHKTFFSPSRDAAALHFCWDIPKYAFCQVWLARPGKAAQELRNSVVNTVLWTPDGQYLIGAGNNTVRLWNLAGGLRVTTPKGPTLPGQSPSADITGMRLSGQTLCVFLREDWYRPDASGHITQTNLTTVRYALPSLRRLGAQSTVSATTGPRRTGISACLSRANQQAAPHTAVPA
ncbi:hypothetical protein [Deinococcus sp.]|uniref:hypothetical protein n=1 Tax=Deinococcus sp. TaxID=47478 RepID=UPI0025C2FA77|nr:hypothetical protein [Deinococcus sp.]